MDFKLLESVPDAMVIVDRRGRIVYANGVAERLFGYSASELTGESIEILLPARFRTPHRVHREGYSAAPRVRPMELGLDLYGLRKDGVEFSAEISLAPLETGEGSFVMSAIRDVSERKRIEERARLYHQAQEEVRERDEFLSIAAHELRTPVTALQLQLQLLRRAAEKSAAGFPQELRVKVEALERQTRRIAVLVNELLDLSRMGLDKMELRPEEFALADLVKEMVMSLQAEIDQSGSTVELTARAPGRGVWDRIRLGQVLTNLLGNAVKFGRGEPIAVTVDEDEAVARLVVSDHGIGIAREDQIRVFQRFERAVPAHHFGGLGLGLYIARQIVEAHGGVIHLASEPSAGSTFTVELPRARPAAAPPDPQTMRAPPGSAV